MPQEYRETYEKSTSFSSVLLSLDQDEDLNEAQFIRLISDTYCEDDTCNEIAELLAKKLHDGKKQEILEALKSID
jgi:hypothetical protein